MDASSYLSEEEIVELHAWTIGLLGGMGGIRDRGALQSCVAQPMTAVFGEERFRTAFDKAAAYCFFVVRLHPFFDGNKRTGFLAARTFLLDNGYKPIFDEDEIYDVIDAVARGEADIDDLAAIFRRSVGSPGVNSA